MRNVGHAQSLKRLERFKWGGEGGGRRESVEIGTINKSIQAPGSLLIIPFYKNPRKILSNDSHMRFS